MPGFRIFSVFKYVGNDSRPGFRIFSVFKYVGNDSRVVPQKIPKMLDELKKTEYNTIIEQ